MNYTLNMNRQANIDVANFINRILLYDRPNKINFFLKLRSFLEILNSMPYLGKIIFQTDLEIRQIIYQKYRILYTITEHAVHILRIINSRMNLEDNFHLLDNLIS